MILRYVCVKLAQHNKTAFISAKENKQKHTEQNTIGVKSKVLLSCIHSAPLLSLDQFKDTKIMMNLIIFGLKYLHQSQQLKYHSLKMNNSV